MKILVVGGGVAGPAFCLFCKKFGIDAEITLAERAPEFKNIGFAISLWGNGRKILDQLDLVKNIDDKEGYEIPWDAIETSTHKILKSFYFDIFKRFGPTIIITRSALQLALVEAMKKENINIRLNSPVKIIDSQPDGATVTLGDSLPEKFDLIVAADGTRSSIRENIFGPDKLKLYGVAFWIFWVPKGFSHPQGLLHILKNGKTAFLCPIGERAYLFLSVKDHPPEIEPPEDRKEVLLKLFSDFDEDILGMIKAVENSKEIMRDNTAHIEMNEWYKNRVVLIGDAQHGLSPATGMGASLALEDAQVLAEELSKNLDIGTALEKFTARRAPRIRALKRISRRFDGWINATGVKAMTRDLLCFLMPEEYFTGSFRRFLQKKI